MLLIVLNQPERIYFRKWHFDKELIIVDLLILCVTSEVWFKALIIFQIVFAHRTLWLDYDRGWLRIKMFSDCHVNCQSFFGEAFNWCFCQSELISIGTVSKMALCVCIQRYIVNLMLKHFGARAEVVLFFCICQNVSRAMFVCDSVNNVSVSCS